MFDFIYYAVTFLVLYLSAIIFNLNLTPDIPSGFELKRLAKDGDPLAKKKSWALKNKEEVGLTLNYLFLITQAGFILLMSSKIGKIWPALLLSLSVIFGIRALQASNKLKRMFEFWNKFFIKKIRNVVKEIAPVLKVLTSKKSKDESIKRAFYSEAEFEFVFSRDSEVLDTPTKTKIQRMLNCPKTKIKDVMVKIDEIPKVDVNLSLTPVIYDELHQKGYDMALAFQGSDDNLTGLLYLTGSEAINQLDQSGGSVRVGDKMEQGIQYVSESTRLNDLISGFLKGGQNAVFVTGASGQVKGVVTSRSLLAWVSGA